MSLSSMISSTLIPALSSMRVNVPEAISELISSHKSVSYKQLSSMEEGLQCILQTLDSSQGKALSDLFYTCLLRSSLKVPAFPISAAHTASKSLVYLSSQRVLTAEYFLDKLVEKVISSLIYQDSLKNFAGYAPVILCLDEFFGYNSTLPIKELIEIKIRPLLIETVQMDEFPALTQALSYCYDLADAKVVLSQSKASLEESISAQFERYSGASLLNTLRGKTLHPQVSNYLTSLTGQEEGSIEHHSGEIRKQDILFKDNRYTYTHATHKVEIRRGLYENSTVAIKIYKTNDEVLASEANKEIAILKDLSGCPGFLQFYGSYHSVPDDFEDWKFELGIVTEFCPNSLEQDIQGHIVVNSPYSEEQLSIAAASLLQGFCYLVNYKHLAHCDIKPDNIMISSTGEFKIIDFNSFEQYNSTVSIAKGRQFSPVGTPDYMSFEQRKAYDLGKAYSGNTELSDVYSLGLTLLRMAILQPISQFNTAKGREAQRAAIKGVKYQWLAEMLTDMLVTDTSERLTFKQSMKHLPFTATV